MLYDRLRRALRAVEVLSLTPRDYPYRLNPRGVRVLRYLEQRQVRAIVREAGLPEGVLRTPGEVRRMQAQAAANRKDPP